MVITDFHTTSMMLPKYTVLFAAHQDIGSRATQEDYFANYNDECFALADGVGGMPHGAAAAKLAGDTAIWGYRQIRLRHSYWRDKKLFMNRIFRSTNIAVWQKRREQGYGDGLATTLSVVMVGTRTFWVGSVGDTAVFRYSDGQLEKLTENDVDAEGYLTKTLGTQRFGLFPAFRTGDFLVNDTLCMATDGITNAVTDREVSELLRLTGDTSQHVAAAAGNIIRKARENRGSDNMSICIIKKIASGSSLTGQSSR
ncbi:protein phosphatase 2C domain-containing protein [Patescibacteria group bacterium]|nr:protein phosphatase 2C domain-containing protein [Patescibacteria group bacterium]